MKRNKVTYINPEQITTETLQPEEYVGRHALDAATLDHMTPQQVADAVQAAAPRYTTVKRWAKEALATLIVLAIGLLLIFLLSGCSAPVEGGTLIKVHCSEWTRDEMRNITLSIACDAWAEKNNVDTSEWLSKQPREPLYVVPPLPDYGIPADFSLLNAPLCNCELDDDA